jgi:hypothetical protein
MINGCLAAMLMFSPLNGPAGAAPRTDAAPPARETTATLRALEAYGRLPLIFERSIDPVEGTPRFVAGGADYRVVVTARGAQLVLRDVARGRRSGASGEAIIDLRFDGGDAAPRLDGVDLQPTRIHRFGGRAGAQGRLDIPTYARVALSNAYPGIDVVFYGRDRRLEYDVLVAPGADPARFGFRIDGADDVALDDRGNLVLAAGMRTMTLQRPVAYQEEAGRREAVASAFALDENRRVRIRVGTYDRERPLVIDPVLSYATYLGGSEGEQGTAIAVDAVGNAYVTGYTASGDFPIATAYDRTLGRKGDVDVFVSKLNATGTALVWSTYLGGSGSTDRATGIAVDHAGNAYVTGATSGADFPVSASAWQKGVAGGGAFVAKLGPSGNALAYSTYVANATANAIGVDASGNAYVTGSATSSFATTTGAFERTSRSASTTGFVLKLNTTGSAPLFATFLGGSGSDAPMSIAIDAEGNALVAGWTTSGDFPVVNAFQSALRGQKDAFVTKLDASGAHLLYSTFLGGALDDSANAIAVDASGSAYVAGETYSSDFPSKDGYQSRKSGSRLVNSSLGNAFVAKLGPAGSTLAYATFLGGEICTGFCQTLGLVPQYPGDVAYGIAVDGAGHAYVAGLARTYTFPLVDSAAVRKQQDNQDSSFIAKIAASGADLLWSTFIRTDYGDADSGLTRFPPGAATGVAVDATGAAYVTGDASITSHFQPTPGAFQTTGIGPNAVIVKYAPGPAMSLTTSNDQADAPAAVTFTATVAGAPVTGNVTFIDGRVAIASASLSGNRAIVNVTLPAGIHTIGALLRGAGIVADAPTLYQVVDNPLVCN